MIMDVHRPSTIAPLRAVRPGQHSVILMEMAAQSPAQIVESREQRAFPTKQIPSVPFFQSTLVPSKIS